MTTLASPTVNEPNTVDNGDVFFDAPVPDLVAYCAKTELGGLRIRLLFDMCHCSIAAVIAHGPDERRDGAGTRVSNQ